MRGKYHSPKDYLDAANSLETTESELSALAKSEYDFVKVAVVKNPNVTSEILDFLIPLTFDCWNKQELALALVQNLKTSQESLRKIAVKLLPFLDNMRGNYMASRAGIFLCCRHDTPLEVIEKILQSEIVSKLFRRKIARESRRKDVLDLLLSDKSEAVRKRAANNIESNVVN